MLRASTTCPRSRTIRRLYRLPSIYTTTIHDSYSLPSLPPCPPPAVVVFLPPRSSSLLPSHPSFCPSFWHALIPSPPPPSGTTTTIIITVVVFVPPRGSFSFPLCALSLFLVPLSLDSFLSSLSYAFPLRRGALVRLSLSPVLRLLRVSLPSPPNDIREHERS